LRSIYDKMSAVVLDRDLYLEGKHPPMDKRPAIWCVQRFIYRGVHARARPLHGVSHPSCRCRPARCAANTSPSFASAPLNFPPFLHMGALTLCNPPSPSHGCSHALHPDPSPAPTRPIQVCAGIFARLRRAGHRADIPRRRGSTSRSDEECACRILCQKCAHSRPRHLHWRQLAGG
jgi:hypothetical protein